MRKGRRLDFILHMEEVNKTVLTKKKMIFGLFQNNHNRTEQEGLGGERLAVGCIRETADRGISRTQGPSEGRL